MYRSFCFVDPEIKIYVTQTPRIVEYEKKNTK